jgi:hypothetical protein|tara:strand:- start:582 stop:776 length:195 start_codon:yes stop_codon:yes gene_type:complete
MARDKKKLLREALDLMQQAEDLQEKEGSEKREEFDLFLRLTLHNEVVGILEDIKSLLEGNINKK